MSKFDLSGGSQGKCDPDLYKNGTRVAMLAGANSAIIECIVKEVARITGHPADWNYVGGRAIVMTSGDPEEVRDVLWKLTEPLMRKVL